MLSKTWFIILFVFLVLIIIPVIIIKGIFWGRDTEPLIINVYLNEQDQVVVMELSDYLRGVVAAEMPAIYEMEALKAQAVASRTYTLKHFTRYGGSGCELHKKADICISPDHCQAWISEEEMQERWGFLAFFYYWSKINKAVEETKGEVLVYNDQLIDAVYHANSGGQTEDARYVWGNYLPYLESVISPYDVESSKGYFRQLLFTTGEIVNKLELNDEENNKKSEIGLLEILKRSESGRVLKIRAGSREMTGIEVRKKLILPSSKFEIESKDDMYYFKVYGKGHGAGLSQDGSNGFAKNGKDYIAILKHYYQKADIVQLKDVR